MTHNDDGSQVGYFNVETENWVLMTSKYEQLRRDIEKYISSIGLSELDILYYIKHFN